MELVDILTIAIIIGISYQFWQLRGIAESTKRYCQLYCKQQNLQYLDLARVRTSLSIKHGFRWENTYLLSFSSDGETAYEGKVHTIGKKIASMDLPVYRVENEW